MDPIHSQTMKPIVAYHTRIYTPYPCKISPPISAIASNRTARVSPNITFQFKWVPTKSGSHFSDPLQHPYYLKSTVPGFFCHQQFLLIMSTSRAPCLPPVSCHQYSHPVLGSRNFDQSSEKGSFDSWRTCALQNSQILSPLLRSKTPQR